MYGNNFVLSIKRNASILKEMNGHVSLPFDTEYKIRLKNKNNREAMAKVSIDGVQVCNLGDFVVGAGSSLDLERFIDADLARGKKFKFVSLDHSEVDDPTSSENGIVKVEFRLKKQMPYICFDPIKVDIKPLGKDYTIDGTGNFNLYYNNSSDSKKCCDSNTYTVNYCASDLTRSAPQAGATIGGEVSSQQFQYVSDFETEDTPTILTLKLVSSIDLNNKKAVSTKISKGIFCSACGNKVKFNHKYCSKCGSKLE